jgi:hypothetical protein
VNPLRPNLTGQGPLQTPARPAPSAAQRAFFQAAMGQAAQAGPSPSPTMATPTQRVPGELPAEPPQRLLRPGSLLDIRV